MKANSKEINKRLSAVWKGIFQISPYQTQSGTVALAMPDSVYWLPTWRKVDEFLRESFLEQYEYRAGSFDCDDFALVLHAFVVQERYVQIEKRKIKKPEWLPWAFGQIWGTVFNGKHLRHAINIAITSDQGVVLIEPQNDKIWNASYPDDTVHFIRI